MPTCRRHLFRFSALWALVALLPASGFAAGIMPAPKQVSDHVYAWIGPLGGPSKDNNGYRMNLSFVVGKKAVAVVDTGYTEAMAREMLDHIAAITKAPVKYAVNTNSQPHRYMGNEVFRAAGAAIIAHPKSAARMAARGGNFAQGIERILELKSVTIPGPPDKTPAADLTLDLGGVAIVVKPFAGGHTPGQLVVHVPADNVVMAGDVLYSGRLLAVLEDSSTEQWLKTYAELGQFGDATFIPGHGEPAKLAAFDFPTRQYLELLFGHMSKAVDDGVDLQAAINSLDQSAFSKLANYDQLAGRNASWTYIERERVFFGQ